MTAPTKPFKNLRAQRRLLAILGIGCLVVGLAMFLLQSQPSGSGFVAKWSPKSAADVLSLTIAMAGIAFLIAAALMSTLMTVMPKWYREMAEDQASQSATKRYTQTVLKCMLIYAVVLAFSIGSGVFMKLPAALNAVLAVAPVIPMAFLMHAHLTWIRAIDELQRRIELESIGIAAMLTTLICMALGFLANAKVIELNAALMLLMVFPLLCVTYGIGKFFVARHYQ